MTLLSFENVSKRFPDGRREVAALEDVSLEVYEGDFVGLWGMRRSGKSSLLRIAAGEELPDEGRVFFDGQELTSLSPDRRARLRRHRGIALVVLEWHPAASNKPVVDHVALPLLSDGMSMRDARKGAYKALERVGIPDCAHGPLSGLSRSERVRVVLARSLVHQPRLLLVDEPAVLLRPSEAHALYDLLHSLGKQGDLALVVASEDIGPIRKARRVMSIDSGIVRSMDHPGTVLQFRDPGRR
jgi:putative ABC transport system ATP-binding protein